MWTPMCFCTYWVLAYFRLTTLGHRSEIEMVIGKLVWFYNKCVWNYWSIWFWLYLNWDRFVLKNWVSFKTCFPKFHFDLGYVVFKFIGESVFDFEFVGNWNAWFRNYWDSSWNWNHFFENSIWYLVLSRLNLSKYLYLDLALFEFKFLNS